MTDLPSRMVEAESITSSSGAAAEASAGGLRRLALRGAVWTTLGEVIGQALRLVGNVVLAWLLGRAAFGVMTYVNIAKRGLEMFSDLGLAPNIIQSKRGLDPRFLNTAWTIQVLRGLVLWVVSCLIALPMALVYDEPGSGMPSLMWLLPAASLTAPIAALASTGIFVLNRRLELGKVTLLEVVQITVSTAAMIAIALVWRSVWALVIGGIIGVSARTVLSHVAIRQWRPRLGWDADAVRELLRFGSWVFIATALTFLSGYTDRLILGKCIGLEWLGVFSVAYGIAEAARSLVTKVNNRVTLPAVSNRNHLPPGELRTIVLRHRGPMLLWLAAGLAALTVAGDQIIVLLYPEEFHEAAWMLPLLTIGLWPRLLSSTIYPMLLAVGKPRWNAVGSLTKLVLVAVGIPVGFASWGLAGAVLAVALAELPLYLPALVGAAWEGLGTTRQDLQTTLAFGLMLLLLLVLRSELGWGHPFVGMTALVGH